MGNGAAAEYQAMQPATAGSGPRERITVQRPFRTPDQAGGEMTMWSNVAGFWASVHREPPREAWPCQNGTGVAVWIATEYRDGIEPGLRVMLRDEPFVIDQVFCLHEQRPDMWLRVVRAEAADTAAIV